MKPSIATPQPSTAAGGMALITLAAFTWSTIGVAVDLLYGLAETNPLSVGLLRLLLAAPAMLIACRLVVGRGCLRIERRHLAVMALIGAAFAGYQICYFAAIPRLGVATAVLINICSAPVITALLARAVLGERLTPTVLAAMAGAVLGTALLVGGAPEAASQSDLLIGAALAFGAGICYSVVGLGSRAVAPHYHPLQPLAVAFSLGALLLLPMALAGGLILSYPPAGWGLLIYLGVVPTALAYVFYLRGLRSVPATVAATVSLLEPLGSTLLAVVLLGERLGGTAIIGAALLLASMGLLYRGKR